MLRVVLFLSLLIGMHGSLTAGAHKDYEGCAECEQSLEGINPQHSLEDTIYYEAAQYDPRVEQIRQFFTKHKSPAAKYAELLIQVADEYALDWRLLPALSFVETGGGIYKHNNNIFGWDSGKTKFPSIEEGIRHVAAAFQAGPYKDKTTVQKIRVYNNVNLNYNNVIQRVMKQIEDTTFPTPIA